MTVERIVIAGAGQAGLQCAVSLRQAGFEGRISLIGAESSPPYQRPPLSKDFLKGALAVERLYFRTAQFYVDQRIELATGVRVAEIERQRRTVRLSDGVCLEYDALVIAVGSRPRKFDLRAADLPGVFEMRTIDDVERLRPHMRPGARMVIVGGGYIGLEVAAVARQLGLEVVLLESAPQILGRVTGPEVASFYAAAHREAGVDLRVAVQLEAFEGGDRVSAVRLADGERIECDLVLVGVGATPNQEIAAAAGLQCCNGIRVGADARTSDPAVFAIGDCAYRPIACTGGEGRLESVHNAIEGGKIAAAAILGRGLAPQETPWFWSDQYDLKLQTAGICIGADVRVMRLKTARSFAVFYLRSGVVTAVDAVNAAPEFMIGRKLVGVAARVDPAMLSDPSVSMKDIAPAQLG
ncbi:MAG: NAD(P)/FAD-dependent oxidoreductase [Steroidobacter sp.]